jgi:hypothetical protein
MLKLTYVYYSNGIDAHIYTYIHIHTYTYIYIHIHLNTCIYKHIHMIHANSDQYMHICIPANVSLEGI